MDKYMIQLEEALKKMRKPTLRSEAKNRMRQSMLAHMKTPISSDVKYPSLERVRDYVKKVTEVTQPSSLFKAKVKENILAVIGKRKFGFNFFWNIGRNWQRVLATLMVGVISLTSFTVYLADIPVTKAAKKTAFQELYGDVDVLRNGETIEAYKYMQLQEGDIIITGDNGLAVIRYFDDSVSRLSPLTELRMQRLYQDEKIQSKSEVEIELTNGHVWNQTVNLVDKQSSFEVKVDGVKARTSEKASFDIEHNKEIKKVAVAVYDNKVEVSVPEKRKEKKQVVVEGYSVEFENNQSKEEKIALDTKEDALWVEVNKAEDKQHKQDVDKEKEEEVKKDAGILPSDPLYSAKKINETTKLLVTTNETDKVKIQIDIAVKRLTEASALLTDGDTEGAENLLEEFNQAVEEIAPKIEGSDELKDYAKSAFADKTKELSTVLPDGKRYAAKEALREAQLALATTNDEKQGEVLNAAQEKVVEAKELFAEEKSEHAEETLLDAAKDIATVSADKEEILNSEKAQQTEETLSTVRVLKEAVKDDSGVATEVKMIIDATEEALEKPLDVVSESDSAVVLTIDVAPTVQLKEVQE